MLRHKQVSIALLTAMIIMKLSRNPKAKNGTAFTKKTANTIL